ncbi:MAG: hypothetical protein JW874_01080 [Spirochaetales bacterium]|nr:hypothetical protein [Spirochaetales bacterium]
MMKVSVMKKTLSVILIFFFCTAAVFTQEPADIFRQEALAGFQMYLDRIAEEASAPDQWQSEAQSAFEEAMRQWEEAVLLEGLDPAAFVMDLEADLQTQMEEQYAAWLVDRFFSEHGDFGFPDLYTSLDRVRLEFLYGADNVEDIPFDANGSPVLKESENTEQDIRYMKAALAAGSSSVLDSWVNTTTAKANSLLELLSATDEAPDRKLYLDRFQLSLAEYRNRLTRELDRISIKEERRLIALRTRDTYSLQAATQERTAQEVAGALITEAQERTANTISRVFAQLDGSCDSSGIVSIEIDPDEWLESFRLELERGLEKWDDTEEAFLMERADWERTAMESLEGGQQEWIDAYAELQTARDEWENEIRALLEEGRGRLENMETEVLQAVSDAREIYEEALENRETSLEAKAAALVDMYLDAGQMMKTAAESGGYWLEKLPGGDRFEFKDFYDDYLQALADAAALQDEAEPETDEETTMRLFIEAVQAELGIEMYRVSDALKELAFWYGVFIQYEEYAGYTREELANSYGVVLWGNAAEQDNPLAVINSENQDLWEEIYLDDYQVELLKAQALKQYWDHQYEIAQAVCTYAADMSADKETAAETIADHTVKKDAYDTAQDAYDLAATGLEALSADINASRDAMDDAWDAVVEAREEMEEARQLCQEAFDLWKTDNEDYYKRLLRYNYRELLIELDMMQPEDGEEDPKTEAELYIDFMIASQTWLSKEKTETAAMQIDRLVSGDSSDGLESLASLKNLTTAFAAWTLDNTDTQEEFENSLEFMENSAYCSQVSAMYGSYLDAQQNLAAIAGGNNPEDIEMDEADYRLQAYASLQMITGLMQQAMQQVESDLENRIASINLLAHNNLSQWLTANGISVDPAANTEAMISQPGTELEKAYYAETLANAQFELATANKVIALLDADSLALPAGLAFTNIAGLSSATEAVLTDTAAWFLLMYNGFGDTQDGDAGEDGGPTRFEAFSETITEMRNALSALVTFLEAHTYYFTDTESEVQALRALIAEYGFAGEFLSGGTIFCEGPADLSMVYRNNNRNTLLEKNSIYSAFYEYSSLSPALQQYYREKGISDFETTLKNEDLLTVNTSVNAVNETVTSYVFEDPDNVWDNLVAKAMTSDEIARWYGDLEEELYGISSSLPEYMTIRINAWMSAIGEYLALMINSEAPENGVEARLENTFDSIGNARKLIEYGSEHEDSLSCFLNTDLNALFGLYVFKIENARFTDNTAQIDTAELRNILVGETAGLLAEKVISDDEFVSPALTAESDWTEALTSVLFSNSIYETVHTGIIDGLRDDIINAAKLIAAQAAALSDLLTMGEDAPGWWSGLSERAELAAENYESYVYAGSLRAWDFNATLILINAQNAYNGLLTETDIDTILAGIISGLDPENEETDKLYYHCRDMLYAAAKAEADALKTGEAVGPEMRAQKITDSLLDSLSEMENDMISFCTKDGHGIYAKMYLLGLVEELESCAGASAMTVAAFARNCLHLTAYELADIEYGKYSVLGGEDRTAWIASHNERLYVDFLSIQVLNGNDISNQLAQGLAYGSSLSPESQDRLKFIGEIYAIKDNWVEWLDGPFIDYFLANTQTMDTGSRLEALRILSGGTLSAQNPCSGLTLQQSLACLIDSRAASYRTLATKWLEEIMKTAMDDINSLQKEAEFLSLRDAFYEMQESGLESYRSALSAENFVLAEPTASEEAETYASTAVAEGTLAIDDSHGNIGRIKSDNWYDNMLLERYNQCADNAALLEASILAAREYKECSWAESSGLLADGRITALRDLCSGAANDWNILSGIKDIYAAFRTEADDEDKDAYEDTYEEWAEKVEQLGLLKSAIADTGKTLALTAMSNTEIYSYYQNALTGLDAADADYDEAKEAWEITADEFEEAVAGYNTSRETVKGLYEALEKARSDYEIIDAVRTFAESGYLLTPEEIARYEDCEDDDPDDSTPAADIPDGINPFAQRDKAGLKSERATILFNVIQDIAAENSSVLYYEDPEDADNEQSENYSRAYNDYRDYYLKTLIFSETAMVLNATLESQEILVQELAAEA